MKYNCNKCGKEFDKKSNYEYHMRRIRPCINPIMVTNNQLKDDKYIQDNIPPKKRQIGVLSLQKTAKLAVDVLGNNLLQNKIEIDNLINETSSTIISGNLNKTLICEYCSKIFLRKDYLSRHIKNRCKVKKIKDIQYNELTNKISQQEEVINNLTEKIQNLEDNNLSTSIIVSKAKNSNKKLLELNNSNNLTNTNNLTNSNNLTNTNNIIFNGTVNFGDESIEKLTEKEILQTLKSRSSAFTNFIKLMHINDNIPEQQNILINNLRSNTAIVYEDDKILTKNRKEVISELISMRTSDLEDLLKDKYQNKKITKKDFEIISNIIEFLKYSYFETEDIDGNVIKADSDMIKSLRKHYEDIILLFYNSREIISKNINTSTNQKKPKEETRISEYF